MTNNYYEILGVSRTASSAQIKAAFYTLSKKYHPDINPKTANLFRNMNEAYQTLRDPDKRKKYDELLDLGVEDNSNDANIFTESFKDTYYTNPEYYQDPTKEPIVCWRSHANLLFYNWLNYYVYQTTPYDINEIK